MAAIYRLKGLGWLASGTVVALGFYLVSSQVAAERKKLDAVDAKIGSAQRDIRALETEFDVRANLAQLERWNGDTLALSVPTATQFVRDDAALAALSPHAAPVLPGDEGAMRSVALIVPSRRGLDIAPVDATAAAAATLPAVQTAAATSVGTPAPAKIVKAVAVRAAAATPALTPIAVTAATERPRNIRAAAMLDKSLLSETTTGDLLSGARVERSRLR